VVVKEANPVSPMRDVPLRIGRPRTTPGQSPIVQGTDTVRLDTAVPIAVVPIVLVGQLATRAASAIRRPCWLACGHRLLDRMPHSPPMGRLTRFVSSAATGGFGACELATLRT
jgi:hypothetical protein